MRSHSDFKGDHSAVTIHNRKKQNLFYDMRWEANVSAAGLSTLWFVKETRIKELLHNLKGGQSAFNVFASH